jgi:2-polyprenyl-3-methyl-5-hydroxy-6-metoxy-1,4-benzoquinol methylase
MNNTFDERFVFSQATQSQLIYDEHLVRYQLAQSLASGKRVLDVAAGSGYGSKMLAEAGAVNVKAIDINKEAIANAKKNYNHKNLEFICDSAESLATIPNSSIDLIVSFETIEHLTNYQEYLKNLKRVLAPGGLVLISTPNKEIFKQKNPFHIKEFTRNEFEIVLKQYFNQVRILNQYNGLASYIQTDKETKASLSSRGEAMYFIALGGDNLPEGIIGMASVNPAALKRWQNNPGWKMVNIIYSLLVKIGILKR